jgi:hypothetical protein
MIAPLSKYGPSGKTWRQEREERKAARRAQERKAKQEAKAMDFGRCRWPQCDCAGAAVTRPLESAHRRAKGMGGNPDGSRNDPRNLITLCHDRHQGPKSLHSGDLKVVPLTDEGTRGACEFWSTDERGQPYLVARERAPFVYERD